MACNAPKLRRFIKVPVATATARDRSSFFSAAGVRSITPAFGDNLQRRDFTPPAGFFTLDIVALLLLENNPTPPLFHRADVPFLTNRRGPLMVRCWCVPFPGTSGVAEPHPQPTRRRFSFPERLLSRHRLAVGGKAFANDCCSSSQTATLRIVSATKGGQPTASLPVGTKLPSNQDGRDPSFEAHLDYQRFSTSTS